MKRGARIAIGAAALAAVVVTAAPSPAQGQVRVEGRFRLPHGDVAVSVGDRHYGRRHRGGYYGYHRYPVGSYVPYGYRVHRRSRLGYGFYSPAFVCRAHRVRHAHWVPVRRHHTRWIVVEQPVVVERYVERRPYRGDDYYDDDYYEDGYGRDPYYDFNRELGDPSYRRPARHVHTDRCRH